MKNNTRKKGNTNSSKLDTSVGSYFGDYVLEGFTADAEYLARERDDALSLIMLSTDCVSLTMLSSLSSKVQRKL